MSVDDDESRALTGAICILVPQLGIGDVQITHATPKAAELYGFACATDLVGRYLSDLQTWSARERGKKRWAQRLLNKTLSPEYCTLVVRPDGEIVGHRGRLVSHLASQQGMTFLTELEIVEQLDEPPMPDLDAVGISPQLAEDLTGKFTVAQVRDMMTNDTLSLHFPETFRYIVRQYERLSTQYLGWQPGQGLDLMLSGHGSWSLDAKKAESPVFLSLSCDPCGRHWYARRFDTRQCPSCGRGGAYSPIACPNSPLARPLG